MDLGNYVDVPTRLKLALAELPDLRIVETRPEVVSIDQSTFISVTVTVYRTADDPVPVVATAWEPFPGRTPYTKGSEMMNCSTSALGRALGFLGYGLGSSIASRDEVQARKADRSQPESAAEKRKPAPKTKVPAADEPTADQFRMMNALFEKLGFTSRESKVEFVAHTLGREISSAKDATRAEISQCIEALNALDQMGAEVTE